MGFQSTRRTGAKSAQAKATIDLTLFQSTRPRRTPSVNVLQQWHRELFQSTQARYHLFAGCGIDQAFSIHARMRGAILWGYHNLRMNKFQFTRPSGARLMRVFDKDIQNSF
jgi:hypothetical protein